MQAQVNKNKKKEHAMNRAPNGRFQKKNKNGDTKVDVTVQSTLPKGVYAILIALLAVVALLAYSNYSHAEEGVPEEAVVKAEVQSEATIQPESPITYINGMSVSIDSEGQPIGKISTSQVTAKVYTHSMSVAETRLVLDSVATCIDGTTFGNMVEVRGCLSEVEFITYDVYKTGVLDRLRTWW